MGSVDLSALGDEYSVDESGNVLIVDPPRDPQRLAAETKAVVIEQAPLPLEDTFLLHSNPGASKVIYMDFDGHVDDPAYSIDGNDSSFSDAELAEIQRAWEQASEDFLPFDVDVTTEDPGVAALQKTGAGDQYYGVRVVISQFDGSSGGWAYLWSFSWNYDQPAYVDTNGVGTGYKNVAEVVSHEAGHTLGLYHDGFDDGITVSAYYAGHGSGETGWAPIMGAGYYRSLVQWSRGEYAGADQTEDDLAIITTFNGFGYRSDDHSNAMASADPLAMLDLTTVSDEGIIERTADVDFFVFETGAGTIELDIDNFYRSPNLDILAQLYDVDGNLVASDNPTDQLDAYLNVNVIGGTYFLSIEGIGKGDPATGYSDYGSLGYYSISGTVVSVVSEASIAGRHVFYDNSSYDDEAIGLTDFDAIAADKVALLPGEPASFANYTSYSKGINGILIDIYDLANPAAISTADFTVRVGNNNDPGSWLFGPAPVVVGVRLGEGVGGSDRITLKWNDNDIQNQWVQITVLANGNTGLPQDDVFCFGSAIGEVGNSSTDAQVDESDVLETRNNPQPFFDPAPIDNNYDFNRDQRVNSLDTLIVRNHQTQPADALMLLNQASPILITEADTGNPDAIEIQNVSSNTLNTSGWVVAANDAKNSAINDVHDPLWTLPASMAPGELLYRPDTGPDNISWQSADVGWVMILDNQGSLVDFVIWGYDAAELASFEVDIGGFTGIRVEEAWSGPAVSTVSAPTDVLSRVGQEDHDSASDWTFDAPAAKAVSSKGDALRTMPAKIEWLYEFGPDEFGSVSGKDRQPAGSRPVATAVDRLLATV